MVAINGQIWSPQVYQDVAIQLAMAIALNPACHDGKADTSLLIKLALRWYAGNDRAGKISVCLAAMETDFQRSAESHANEGGGVVGGHF